MREQPTPSTAPVRFASASAGLTGAGGQPHHQELRGRGLAARPDGSSSVHPGQTQLGGGCARGRRAQAAGHRATAKQPGVKAGGAGWDGGPCHRPGQHHEDRRARTNPFPLPSRTRGPGQAAGVCGLSRERNSEAKVSHWPFRWWGPNTLMQGVGTIQPPKT